MRSFGVPILFFLGFVCAQLQTPLAAQGNCYYVYSNSADTFTQRVGPFPNPQACNQSRANALNSRPNGRAGPCSCASPSNNSAPRATSSAPSTDSEVEREHQEWLRKQEELRKQQAAEAEREKAEKQREFDAEKNAALSSMKGIYANDNELKGTGGTESTELKSATESSDTELKTVAPPPAAPVHQTPHVIQTAWRQLHCSASISAQAITGAKAGVSDERLKYLAGQAADAMNGTAVAVTCNQGPPLQVQLDSSAVWRYRTVYLPQIMTRISSDAAAVRKTKRESLAADAQVRQDKQRVAALKRQVESLGSPPAGNAAQLETYQDQKKKVDDSLAEALKALDMAQQAKQGVDDAGAKAQQDLNTVGTANAAVAQHPEQMDAVFSQLLGNQAPGGVPPPAH